MPRKREAGSAAAEAPAKCVKASGPRPGAARKPRIKKERATEEGEEEEEEEEGEGAETTAGPATRAKGKGAAKAVPVSKFVHAWVPY